MKEILFCRTPVMFRVPLTNNYLLVKFIRLLEDGTYWTIIGH